MPIPALSKWKLKKTKAMPKTTLTFHHCVKWDIVNSTPYEKDTISVCVDNVPLGQYNSVTEALIALLEKETGKQYKIVHDYRLYNGNEMLCVK